MVNARYSRDAIVFWASLILAGSLYAAGTVRDLEYFAVVLFFYGGSWMICMLSFQVASQMVLPAWVRGRGLSVSVMSFTAGMAFGGILWGTVANFTDMETAFQGAALVLLVGTITTYKFHISSNETENV